MADTNKRKGVSLAKGPIATLGIIGIAWGILNLILGDSSFTQQAVDGTVNGQTFLGFEGNGWTNLLWIAAGALLLLGAPLHWGAKTLGIVVGLVLGAASVISMVDGDDVFGIIATNGLTQLLLGAASVALLVLSLLPKVGGKDKGDHEGEHRHRDHDAERHAVRDERPVEREPAAEGRSGRFEREMDPRDERLTDRAGTGPRRERL